jgi:hypothetical protein
MGIYSVFQKYIPQAYPFNYTAELTIGKIMGGTPTDPKVIEGWLKTKLVESRDDLMRAAVAEIMEERGIPADEAAKIVADNKNLSGFKRDKENGLYIEGRQIKAMLKEGANIKWPKHRWGPSKKGTRSFFAEHVFVNDDRVYLGVTEPTDVAQKFVHTFRGSGIQYEEFVEDAVITFNVATDYDFEAGGEVKDMWPLLWLTCEQEGLGASRSQGYGRFATTGWKENSTPEEGWYNYLKPA